MNWYYFKRVAVSVLILAALIALTLYVLFSLILHLSEQKATGLGVVPGGMTPLLMVVALILVVFVAISAWTSSKLIKRPR